MDSRSAYEPLENNKQLITVSRPSTGSAEPSNVKAESETKLKMKKEPPIQVIHVKDEKGKKDKNMEFRAVETIEEFFRPELAKQDDMNSQIFNTEFEINEGESFLIPGADTTQKTFEKANFD
jgi:hypothetical protein